MLPSTGREKGRIGKQCPLKMDRTLSDSYSVVSADTAQAGSSNVAHAQSGSLE